MGKVGFQFRRSTGQGLAGPKGRPGRDMAFSKQKTSEKTCPPQHFYSEREKNTNILQLPAFVERSKQKQYFLKCCDKRAKKVSQWLVSLIVPVALSVFDESTWKANIYDPSWNQQATQKSPPFLFFFVISHYFKDHLIVKTPSEVSKYVDLGSTITHPRYAIAHIKWVGVVGIPDPKNVIMSSRCWRASILL